MSTPQIPKPVKLVASILSAEPQLLDSGIEEMEHCFGAVDFSTKPAPFVHTRYYCAEMGGGIHRRFIAFQTLVKRDRLAEIKLCTNRLEEAFRLPGRGRRINIDPGFITLDNLVLATGKNFTHRIYLGSGIYADLTLIYRKGSFRPLPWTYPDYAESSVVHMFNEIRSRYREQLKMQTN
ncbi:MAG: DUF4416 family protein [Deltaproteobacteria bacterium]|nr:DUF4416 family protein [Deltaproteobacteria bacterium]MBW2308178.1 DUF4416 family protein [Deltaproteobacteria bacterium]